MSEHDQAPPPMDANLRALLRGTTTSFDAEASRHLDRAFDRLALALPDLGASPSGAEPSIPANLGASAAVTKVGMTKLAAPVIGSLLVGSAIGAAVTYAVTPVRERVVYVEQRVVVSAPAALSASPPPPSIAVDDLPSTSKVTPAASAPALSGSDVHTERLMLDEARRAFASGDYAKSLERVERHKARFPSGVLSEEREALAVRALAGGGNKAEAAKRARAFVVKYPDSIMRPAVEGAADEP